VLTARELATQISASERFKNAAKIMPTVKSSRNKGILAL
jgi:hypothetical protein